MIDDKDGRAATPLVKPLDGEAPPDAPEPVATDAPVSTDERGHRVDRPDRGGAID